MASQGSYDHPSYLTRQCIDMDPSLAGANGTSAYTSFISDMRIRKATVTARVAGTSSGAGNSMNLIYIGTSVAGFTGTALTTTTTTATIGTFALGSSAAGVTGTTTDMDVLLKAGGVLAVKNGTDATGTAKVMLEAYLDPSATWTGPPGS